MAAPLDRSWFNTLIDDDGSGTTGTIWNKTQVDGLLDTVDGSLAGLVDKTGTPALNQLAIFNDADTITGNPQLTVFDARMRVHGPSPAYELFDNDSVANWYFGINDADNDCCYIGAGYGPAQGLTPALLLRGYPSRVELPSGQLKFPATQIPSADPYTLDDYREGYWTPVLLGASGQSGQVYGIQDGYYIKKGRDVTISGRLDLTTMGTFSGTLRLGGLPFPMMEHYNPGGLSVSHWQQTSTRVLGIQGYGQPSVTAFNLVIAIANSAGTTPLEPTDIANGLLLFFDGHYFAAT